MLAANRGVCVGDVLCAGRCWETPPVPHQMYLSLCWDITKVLKPIHATCRVGTCHTYTGTLRIEPTSGTETQEHSFQWRGI